MSLPAAKHQLGETRPRAALGRPLLEAKDIRRTFGETIALDSCSVSVAPGEIHAVVGENGSGKSTLIQNLSGIVTRILERSSGTASRSKSLPHAQRRQRESPPSSRRP